MRVTYAELLGHTARHTRGRCNVARLRHTHSMRRHHIAIDAWTVEIARLIARGSRAVRARVARRTRH
eukprot:7232567-Lingulodinium_polyedra.AAC.1